MGDPDAYESVDATPDVSEFPVDSSTSGKHYQVAVPAYIPAAAKPPNSYFRHGVPHSAASSFTEGTAGADGTWSQNGSSVALGEDLLKGVVPPDGFVSTLGGVRDHTDGNRVTTTRNDVLEVIGGQYRQLVLSNQPISDDPDPDWTDPSTGTTHDQADGVEEEPSIATHEYANWFYELTSTTSQPGSGSFAEPRLKVADAKSKGYDYYEYANANNLVDIMAGESNLIEKMYANRMLEVMSTVHASHAGWEGTIDELSDGDLKEYMLGKNITEVIKAEWNIEERIEATLGGISELMLAAGGINEVTTAGGAVHEMTAAGGAISEETVAGLGIHELTAAGGAVLEEIIAGLWINELTAAVGVVSEFTLAGTALIDVMYGGDLFLDVMASATAFIEIIAAPLVVEIYATTTKLDVSLGTSYEYDVAHNRFVLEGTELAELKTEVAQLKTELAELDTTCAEVCTMMAEEIGML